MKIIEPLKLISGEVVLKKEDYEMLIASYKNLEKNYSDICDRYRLCKDENETLKQNLIITRKETTREIIEMFADRNYITEKDLINAISQRYGVEIKE